MQECYKDGRNSKNVVLETRHVKFVIASKIQGAFW